MEVTKAVKEGTIVDVRSFSEFSTASVLGAVNVPLPELIQRVDYLKSLKSPLVLCCASGNRSEVATSQLTQLGIECVNGGAWLEVNYLRSLYL